MIQSFSGGLLNRQLIYQTDLPSFQRDFASLKTLDHGTGPAITFTRASDATYFDANGVLQTAANDTPRFDHDPADGSSKGLLIEEARTNVLTYSSDFSNAAWLKNLTVVTADQDTAPDGTATADLIDASSETNGGYPGQVASVTANAFTASVFAKKGTTDFLRIRLDTGGGTSVQALFDVDSGTAGTPSAGVTSSIQAVGSGWYRCAATYTFAGAASSSIAFQPAAAIDNNGPTGTLYLWGAQLEAGAFPTSYIPTTTAAATRAADSAVVTPISSFYNASESSIYAEFTRNQSTNTNGPWALLRDDSLLGASLTYATALGESTAGNKRLRLLSYDTGGVLTGDIHPSTTYEYSTVIKMACGLKEDEAAIAHNGSLDTSSSYDFVGTPERFFIGTNALATVRQLNGHIRKIAYWPKRLTDTLLEQLTT
jgi:hypothetical protein